MINVIVGIIQNENKILVAQRPFAKPYGGDWEFPGGKIEVNETNEDALKRELHEELGIHTTIAEYWFQHFHAYPDKKVLLEVWRVIAFVGEPQSKENQVLRWVTFPELLSLRVLEGNRAILDKIKFVIQ
ncbi:MAG TPA: (deoxy)nucleoside triphosphate pyrophosphohydrolase [Gammaproteobacteria bacterium]|nr:(deoxy)nucleoside triphosphate pyrophosphohydrolase [Gammaproteobacteria bacterium]